MPFIVNARSLNVKLVWMCSSVKLENCTIRSQSQMDSEFSSWWSVGKGPLFPFPSTSRNFLVPRRAYGTDVPMRSCLDSLSVFGKVQALLHTTVKGMKENWPGGREFMAFQGCWRPKLLDAHKPPHPANPVIGPSGMPTWHFSEQLTC